MPFKVNFRNAALLRSRFAIRWPGGGQSASTDMLNAGGNADLVLPDGGPVPGTSCWAVALIEAVSDHESSENFVMPPLDYVNKGVTLTYELGGHATKKWFNLRLPAGFPNDLAKADADAAIRTRNPARTGMCVHDQATGMLYLVIDGMLCHIPNPATFDKLFRSWTYTNIPGASHYPIGRPMSDGAYLGKCSPDPRVFLINNGMKRWIMTPQVFDKFNFNWAIIKEVPAATLSAIPEGMPFMPFP